MRLNKLGQGTDCTIAVLRSITVLLLHYTIKILRYTVPTGKNSVPSYPAEVPPYRPLPLNRIGYTTDYCSLVALNLFEARPLQNSSHFTLPFSTFRTSSTDSLKCQVSYICKQLKSERDDQFNLDCKVPIRQLEQTCRIYTANSISNYWQSVRGVLYIDSRNIVARSDKVSAEQLLLVLRISSNNPKF